MKKRTLFVAVILAMALAQTGCGNETETAATSGTNETSTSENEETGTPETEPYDSNSHYGLSEDDYNFLMENFSSEENDDMTIDEYAETLTDSYEKYADYGITEEQYHALREEQLLNFTSENIGIDFYLELCGVADNEYTRLLSEQLKVTDGLYTNDFEKDLINGILYAYDSSFVIDKIWISSYNDDLSRASIYDDSIDTQMENDCNIILKSVDGKYKYINTHILFSREREINMRAEVTGYGEWERGNWSMSCFVYNDLEEFTPDVRYGLVPSDFNPDMTNFQNEEYDGSITEYILIDGSAYVNYTELFADLSRAMSVYGEYSGDYDDANSEVEKVADRLEEEKEENRKEPYIGMTKAELEESAWGEPEDINKTTTAAGTSEQWCYSNDRYVYLDDGIVTAIQE